MKPGDRPIVVLDEEGYERLEFAPCPRRCRGWDSPGIHIDHRLTELRATVSLQQSEIATFVKAAKLRKEKPVKVESEEFDFGD